MTAELLGADSDERIDAINPTLLEAYIWDWNRIPYTMMRRGLHQLHTPAEDPRIDDWILSNENWLRNVDSTSWQHGLVTLNDADIVFPNSTLTNTGRTIIRSEVYPGFKVLSDSRDPQVIIQPSSAAFKEVFESMSHGLLKNLDWTNVFVAGGGITLGALLSVYAPGRDLDGNQWQSRNIEIYIYGLSSADATTKICCIYDTLRSNLHNTSTLIIRDFNTITFDTVTESPPKRIQIVLKLVESPKDVLLNFDLDICAMGWDGIDVWMLPRAARALETGFNVFTMNLIHGHYLLERRASYSTRVFSYAKKGYGLRILPSYLASLNCPEKTGRETPRGADGSPLDIDQLAKDVRKRTEEKYEEMKLVHGNSRFSYLDLDDAQPRRSCLSGFTLFMRHAVYWEIARRNNATPEDRYEDNPNVIGRRGFRWSRSYAKQMDVVLDSFHDIEIPLVLPCDFATYANEVINRMSRGAYKPILKPSVPGAAWQVDGKGFYTWSIASDLMWRQEDRRIDELFEVLLAFNRVDMPLRGDEDLETHADEDIETQKLIVELSKRGVRKSIADEFKSFAQWIAQGA
ncbi:hypothetical protein B0H11DRAFT_2240373 [Mycena galericulata]|nr:hypothetical protein B0H11DRAFT_2240373 [Mycena galericulata]